MAGDSAAAHRQSRAAHSGRGFTLIELLVVISIVALLVSILLPSLQKAKLAARGLICLTRIDSQLKALHMYASDHNGRLACGSDEKLDFDGFDLPPISQAATHQFWLGRNRQYVAGGVLWQGGFLTVENLFCPFEQDVNPQQQADNAIGRTGRFAYGSYLYRQLDGQAQSPPARLLDRLGNNALGEPVAALLLDMTMTLDWPDVPKRARPHPDGRIGIGFVNGHARLTDGADGRFELRQQDDETVFERLDEILQEADKIGR